MEKTVLPESESRIQTLMYVWFQNSYRQYGKLFIKVTNEGKRTAREGMRLKGEGLRPGVPDIFIALPRGPYAGLWIEVKRPGEAPRANQVQMIETLTAQGYRVEVVTSLATFQELINEYLKL
jgi:hypothetical protein